MAQPSPYAANVGVGMDADFTMMKEMVRVATIMPTSPHQLAVLSLAHLPLLYQQYYHVLQLLKESMAAYVPPNIMFDMQPSKRKYESVSKAS